MILRSILPLSLLSFLATHPLLTSATPSPDPAPIDPTPSKPTPTALILLAAHSIPTTHPITLQDSSWALEPYQLAHSLPQDIHQHINTSLTLLLSEPPGTTTLLFSGGETRRFAGARTEAGGYAELALQLMKERGADLGIWARWINTELYARDSWENLLFGVCRFKEMWGEYPREVKTVSYEFKRGRFERLHAGGLGLRVQVGSVMKEGAQQKTGKGLVMPASEDAEPIPQGSYSSDASSEHPKPIVPPSLNVRSLNPPPANPFPGLAPLFTFYGVPASDTAWERVAAGYEVETYRLFENDPAGCGEVLMKKRMDRGWSRRGNGYAKACPELRGWMVRCEKEVMQ